jgi:hypothetical protein
VNRDTCDRFLEGETYTVNGEVVRCTYIGCGADQDKDNAADWWQRIADPTHPDSPPFVPRSIQTKALSCLALEFHEHARISEKAIQIDDLYRAGGLADASASFGFVSPNVLSIAGDIEARLLEGLQFPEVDTTRHEKLENLWEIYDIFAAQKEAEHQRRANKVSNAPNFYQCAAEGCGIESTKRSGLPKCSGPCSPFLLQQRVSRVVRPLSSFGNTAAITD